MLRAHAAAPASRTPPVRVALATAARLPGLDDDSRLLRDALEREGVDARAEVWDDRRVDWSLYDLVLVRSVWDYVGRRDEFVAWASALPVPVANPADVLSWSTEKTYLRDLAARGVPVVPTLWDPVGVPADGRDWVVKPVISAGAADTARWGSDQREEAARHLRALQGAGRATMAQPYLDGVDTEGETSLVYLGTGFSHAVRRGPLLVAGAAVRAGLADQGDEREVVQARTPTDAQLALAEAAVTAVPGGRERLLYARVDLVPGAAGEPLLLELELAEPSLFLAHADGAADRLARAVSARLSRSARVGPPARRADVLPSGA